MDYNKITNFFGKAFIKQSLATVVILAIFAACAFVYAAATGIPNSFNDGEVIAASQVNENFQALQEQIDALKNSPAEVPVGTIMPFAGTSDTIPEGWELCDGREIIRGAVEEDTYYALFQIIGVKWGVGDGATTFHLPDLRGVFLRGANGERADSYSDPGFASRAWNNPSQKNSEGIGSFQEDAFQGHEHQIDPRRNLSGTGENWPQMTNDHGADHSAFVDSVGITSNGTNGTPRTSNETRPMNAAVNYIIKY